MVVFFLWWTGAPEDSARHVAVNNMYETPMCAATHAHLMLNIQVEGENPTQVRCCQKPGKLVLTRIKRSVFFVTVWRALDLRVFPFFCGDTGAIQPSAFSSFSGSGRAAGSGFSFVSVCVAFSAWRFDTGVAWVPSWFFLRLGCLAAAIYLCFSIFSAGPSSNFTPTRHGWLRQLCHQHFCKADVPNPVS